MQRLVDFENMNGFARAETWEAQRQRILEVADRCPVRRMLESEIKVRSIIS